MNYAVELTEKIEVLQAAILHDTVEDTWVTFDDLKVHLQNVRFHSLPNPFY